jgi:hypothetical protein
MYEMKKWIDLGNKNDKSNNYVKLREMNCKIHENEIQGDIFR